MVDLTPGKSELPTAYREALGKLRTRPPTSLSWASNTPYLVPSSYFYLTELLQTQADHSHSWLLNTPYQHPHLNMYLFLPFQVSPALYRGASVSLT